MGGAGNKRKNLVADKRGAKPAAQSNAAATKAKVSRKSRPQRAKPPAGNAFTRFVRGVVRFVWRIIWG